MRLDTKLLVEARDWWRHQIAFLPLSGGGASTGNFVSMLHRDFGLIAIYYQTLGVEARDSGGARIGWTHLLVQARGAVFISDYEKQYSLSSTSKVDYRLED